MVVEQGRWLAVGKEKERHRRQSIEGYHLFIDSCFYINFHHVVVEESGEAVEGAAEVDAMELGCQGGGASSWGEGDA